MSLLLNSRILIPILAALSMLGALSIDAYLPALPAIASAFSVTAAAAQQTLAIYLFAFAFMTLFYGTLSDSFGRRSVILWAMGAYVLSSLGAGLATNLSTLLLFRFLQGLTAGAGNVIGRAVVGDLYQGSEAQRVIASISIVFGLAPAIAPILGGWLQSALGWRSIFGFIAFFSFILMLCSLRWLPETLAVEKRHPFHFKTLLLSYGKVISHRSFMFQALGIALSFTGVMLYVGSAPAFVLDILHLPVTHFGWLFIPLIGGMTIGSWVSGKWSHRFSGEKIIRIGYITMGLSALSNVFYTYFMQITLPWAVLPLMIYSFGMSIVMPTMTVQCLELFPERRGLAASLQTFIFMAVFAIASGVICPLLFGSAFKLAMGTAVGCALSLVSWSFGSQAAQEEMEAGATEKE
ncbi:MAG: multidrug effflux MFS transporter [Verrucomicrobiota bacterium]